MGVILKTEVDGVQEYNTRKERLDGKFYKEGPENNNITYNNR